MTNAKELLIGRFGKESSSMSYGEAYDFCKKLQELGVEIIELSSDKIEFVWFYHMCGYENGMLECGPRSVKVKEISKLDTEVLDWLIGKIDDVEIVDLQLTDAQLTRIGNLIDLYEDKYNYLLGLQEEMSYIDMFGTKLYRNNEQALADYVNMIVKLQNVFQSGCFDLLNLTIGGDLLSYILKGE